MKLEEWGNLIVSWASFLDPNERFASVDDLGRSGLFARLLRVLKDSSSQELGDGDELLGFLRDQYPSLEFGDEDFDSRENTILRATAFLIYCSLHHEENVLQKKMTDLPGWTQLQLTAFLKELVDVSPTSITRDLIFSEISKILTTVLPENGDGGTHSFGTPLTYTTSPSTEESSHKCSSKKTSKVKKLRNEIEMLTIIKADLSEELEISKEHLKTLEATVQKKDQEIGRLKRELMTAEYSGPPVVEDSKDHELLKMDRLHLVIESLEQERAMLKEDLLLVNEEKEDVLEELQKVRCSLKKAELQKARDDNDRTTLEDQISNLKSIIDELSASNKEQSDYISELRKPQNDSLVYSDSQNGSLILPESLGQQVIDLEIQELKDVLLMKENEIKNNIDLIEDLKMKLKENEENLILTSDDFNHKERTYISEIEMKDSTIKSNKDELRNLECQNIYLSNTLREKESIVVSMQTSIDQLHEEVLLLRARENALTRELQAKCTYTQQLIDEVDTLTIVINENSTEKDLLMKSVAEKESALQQCFVNLEEIQMELGSKSEELASALEYYTEQITFLKTQIKGKEDEILDNINIIGRLESDIENYKICGNDMRSSIVDLDGKIKELTEELSVKSSVCAEMESQIHLLSSVNSDLESDKKKLETQVSLNSALNKTISELKKENNIREGMLKEKEHIIDSLQRSAEERNLKQERALSSLSTQVQTLKSEKAGLESVVLQQSRVVDELTASVDSAKTSGLQQISDLSREITDLKALLEVVQNENVNAKQELACLLSEKENVINKLAAVDLAHSNCEERMSCSESLILELKDKESILKEELCKSSERENSLQASLEKKKIVILGLEQEIASKEESMRDKEAILKEDLGKWKGREEALQAEFNKKLSVISNLKEELKTLQKDLSNRDFNEGILYTKLQAKEAEVNQMKLEVGDLNQQVRLIEEKNIQEINMHIKKIQDLDNTIGKLNKQFVKVNREKEDLIVELDEKTKALLDLKLLQAECDRVKEEKGNLEKEFTLRCQEVSSLQQKLLLIQDELEAVKCKECVLQAQLESNANQIQELSEQISFFQTKLKDSESMKTDLMDQLLVKDELIRELQDKVSSEGRNVSAEVADLKNVLANKIELLEKHSKESNILRLDLELQKKKEDFLESQLEAKVKDLEDLHSKLATAEGESSKLRLTCSGQDETIRSLYTTLHSQNSEIKEKDLQISRLEQEIKTLIRDTVEQGRTGNPPTPLTSTSAEPAKTADLLYSAKDLEDRVQEVKASYAKKVEAYKTSVKKRFAEKLQDMTYTLQNENTDLKEKFTKEQEHVAKLQSELWNASDKLLITQEQNRALLTKLQSRNAFEVMRPTEPLSPLSKARSMEVLSGRNRGIDNFARDISLNESVASASSRRSSVRSLPRGMGKKFSFSTGKVFPAADEDGEVFDNRNLADLKAGVCHIPTEQDRMSTLQYRNSLCPPHLKSSYPAETQFFSKHREDEIKSSYKKPGPPTPSKNGGRLSSQGNDSSTSSVASRKEGVVNESFVLRESNHRKPEASHSCMPKPPTPSRLRALFSSSKKDENSPRKKSTFLRRN